MLCRSEEKESLACLQEQEETLVLGKVLCGSHHAAGGHVVLTTLLGSLCQVLNNFRRCMQEALIAVCDELATEGFCGLNSLYNSSVSTVKVGKGQSGGRRSGVGQPSSLNHPLYTGQEEGGYHVALMSCSLGAPVLL